MASSGGSLQWQRMPGSLAVCRPEEGSCVVRHGIRRRIRSTLLSNVLACYKKRVQCRSLNIINHHVTLTGSNFSPTTTAAVLLSYFLMQVLYFGF